MSDPKFYFELDEYTIYIYCSKAVDLMVKIEETINRGKPLVTPYSVKEHPPHVRPNQHHLHVYFRRASLIIPISHVV